MKTTQDSPAGSFLPQLLVAVVATLAAAGLGYVAANGLKPAPAASSQTPNAPGRGHAGTGTQKAPCSDCEVINLPQ